MDKFKVGDIIFFKSKGGYSTSLWLYRITRIDDNFYYSKAIDNSSSGMTEKRHCEEKYEKVPEIKRILLYDKEKT